MLVDLEQLPRCEEARSFIRRMVVGNGSGALAYDVPMTNSKTQAPDYRLVDYWDTDEYSAKFLDQRLLGLARRRWGHDHAVPMICPDAYGGGLLATAFGAKYDPVMNWTHPAVTRVEDIESLALDVTLNDGLIPKALATIEYVVEKTGGRIPLQMYNLGGPMDIATMAVDDQEFMLALSMNPTACHRILDVCTNLYIEFIKAQQAMVPDFVPSIVDDMCWPNGEGVLCGEDWLSVISPQMAMEFEVPYLNRISDAFGGVAIHACGKLETNYHTLKNHVRNLRGLYFNAGETSFAKAVETFRGSDVILMPRWALNQHYPFESRLDYVKTVLAAKTVDMNVYLIACQCADAAYLDEDPIAVSRQILQMIERYEAKGAIE